MTAVTTGAWSALGGADRRVFRPCDELCVGTCGWGSGEDQATGAGFLEPFDPANRAGGRAVDAHGDARRCFDFERLGGARADGDRDPFGAGDAGDFQRSRAGGIGAGDHRAAVDLGVEREGARGCVALFVENESSAGDAGSARFEPGASALFASVAREHRQRAPRDERDHADHETDLGAGFATLVRLGLAGLLASAFHSLRTSFGFLPFPIAGDATCFDQLGIFALKLGQRSFGLFEGASGFW